MAKKTSKLETLSPVAPIESVPITDSTKVKIEQPRGEKCWNCENYLDVKGKCSACGFDKSLIYNLDLEAERAIEMQEHEVRQRQAQQS